MICEYHRPHSLLEALQLLARAQPETIPLGGGSGIDRSAPEPQAVVDLQDLDLRGFRRKGNILELGACVRLQDWLDAPDSPPAVQEAILHEASYNLRQVGTLAGRLVSADGRSPLATTMLALDAELECHYWEKTGDAILTEKIRLGNLLPQRKTYLKGKLITAIRIPLHARLAYEAVARAPADRPIVCAAVAQWPGKRTRVALGGYGEAPFLAFDGPQPEGAEIAARSAYANAGDEWASAEYRQEMAVVLCKRALEEIIGHPTDHR